MRGGVRISAGDLKGTRLSVPRGVRPTSQMVREALFSRWQMRLSDSRFLDLFAGSGAVGLEAISRGATLAVCVEGERAVGKALSKACRELALTTVEVVLSRLPEQAERVAPGTRFDLVFADPPYDFDRYEELLSVIAARLDPEGEAALEHSVRVMLPERTVGLEHRSTRRYGETCLSFYGAEPC